VAVRLANKSTPAAPLTLPFVLKLKMPTNPYKSSMVSEVAEPVAMTAQSATTTAIKCALIVGGMKLYLTNVKRDSNFYYTILENEGFPTTNDSIAIGIAGSLIATTLLSPLALFLIWYGFGKCKRLQLVPRWERFTIGWGSLATILTVLMLLIESEYIAYAAQRPQHWTTTAVSLLYVAYIYTWWCCSIAHAEKRTNRVRTAISDGPPHAT
jgi:hypothetical protein